MTVRTTISMPDEIWDQVEARQKETGASTSEIVRRALAAYFGTNGAKSLVKKAAPRPAARPTRPATKRAHRPAPSKATTAKRPAKRPTKRPAKVA